MPIAKVTKIRRRARLVGAVIFSIASAGVVASLFIMAQVPHETLLTTVVIGGLITLISMLPSAKKDLEFIFPFAFILILILTALIVLIFGGN